MTLHMKRVTPAYSKVLLAVKKKRSIHDDELGSKQVVPEKNCSNPCFRVQKC